MKFLVTWRLHAGAMDEALALFSETPAEQDQAAMGDKVKLIGRWHDLVGGCGAAVFESDSISAVSAYALQWNRYMEIEISPVIDDEEARAVGLQMAGE
ncbi:DUF3303 domain-containing protein [Calycomorphotria hydatis]|uniref:DUF3303 domain-containing protein n=1 Tax=Calycomorphotria hydatis TaxID=2528027 RepID=A0A517T4R9_9PLAN|nr:DUF3303 family protein [Calycomorphotria hydatis]QDT63358.1 hypothetical protein V22_05790 [Calycomorphotria hydatis]